MAARAARRGNKRQHYGATRYELLAKERKVLLGQRGYHYLCAYLDHWRGEPESSEDLLILSDDGSPMGYQTVTKLFARLKKVCGITDKIYAYITDQDAEEEKRKFSPADDVEIEQRKVKRRGFRNG